MKLKTLLLGSAAALVSQSAFAADGPPLMAFDPNDYVLACEGGFIINGTETCLRVAGEYAFVFQYVPEGHEGQSDFDGFADFGTYMQHEYAIVFSTITPVSVGNVISSLSVGGTAEQDDDGDANTEAVNDVVVSFAWSKDITEIDDFENADTGGVLRGFITSNAHISAWGWLGRQTFDQNGEEDNDEVQMLRYFYEFDKFSLGAAVEDQFSGDTLGDDIAVPDMPVVYFGGSAWDLGFVDNIDFLGVYSNSTFGTVIGGEVDAYWSFGSSDGFIRNGSELLLAVTSVENGYALVDSDNEGPGQYTMVYGSADLSLGGTKFDLGVTGFYRWDPGPTNFLIAVQGEYLFSDYWRLGVEWNYEGVDPSAQHPSGEFNSIEARLRYQPHGDDTLQLTAAALYEFDSQVVNLDFDLNWDPWDGLLQHELSVDFNDATGELAGGDSAFESDILVEYTATHAFGL